MEPVDIYEDARETIRFCFLGADRETVQHALADDALTEEDTQTILDAANTILAHLHTVNTTAHVLQLEDPEDGWINYTHPTTYTAALRVYYTLTQNGWNPEELRVTTHTP
ncbi:hypothetical protein CCICO_04350 [Corynebacterium ciconiae DSM 44920]|uniref:hypothetical protein n=1 Tax=Corynebacterium ciconiae TaxID=227319 RepID=UPI00036DDB72|nr:hypothetical protein [Corynebacterium ciconiae]WKD60907.1 hypothetical protein CCICO_04350 [Corynebacterium ciconiae DSM 44920]